MEIVNKILHSRVKVMSHHGEALVKCDKKVCDFCPIITPLDYNTCFNPLIAGGKKVQEKGEVSLHISWSDKLVNYVIP